MAKKKGLALFLCLALLLGSVATLGVLPTLAAVSGASVTAITAKSDLPTGTSLIAGKQPLKADLSGALTNVVNGAMMTDGRWQGLDDIARYKTSTTQQTVNGTQAEAVPGKEGYYFTYTNNGYAETDVDDTRGRLINEWNATGSFAFDMGAQVTVQQIAVGSSAEPKSWRIGGGPTSEASLQQRLTNYEPAAMLLVAKVYVSSDPTTLFTDDHLAMEYDYSASPLQALRNLYTLASPKEGRYIGFTFNTKSGQIRVSELAVYGEAVDTVTAITAKSDLPAGDSLIAGKQPLKADLSGALTNVVNGAMMTDGRWQGLDDIVQFKTSTTQQTVNGTPAEAVPGKEGYYFTYTNAGYAETDVDDTRARVINEWNATGSFVFDMGVTATVQQIAVGSSAEPKSWRIGSAPTSEASLQQRLTNYEPAAMLLVAKVYVSSDPTTLFTDDHLAMEYNYSASPLQALRNLYTLANPQEGRYIGFTFNTKNGQIRVSELAVYGEKIAGGITPITAKSDLPTDKTNLIQGLMPRDKTGEGQPANTTNVAAMTDGRWQGLDDIVDYAYTTEPKTINGKQAEAVPGKEGYYFDYEAWGYVKTTADNTRTVLARIYDPADAAYFLFDMKTECTVEQIAIGSTTEPKAWAIGGAPTTTADLESRKTVYELSSYLKKGKVYIGSDPAALFDEENLALEYDFSANAAEALRNLFTLTEAKNGRYVGFCFAKFSNAVRVSELAVYGDYVGEPPQSDYTARPVTKESELPTAENLLLGKAIANKPADYLIPTDKAGVPVQVDATHGLSELTDGKIYGINTTEVNKCDFGYVTNSGFAYDLRGAATITGLLVSAVGDRDAAYRITWLDVYVSDDLSAVFDGKPVAHIDLISDGPILEATLKAPVTAQYIGFKAPQIGAYPTVRIGELAVYGSYAATPRPFDTALIAGMQPSDTYLAWAGTPANEMKNSIFTAANEDGMAAATDGKPGNKQADGTFPGRLVLDTRNCNYVEGFRLSEANGGNGQKLETNSPWSVMIYYLGGTAQVNTVRLISSEERGFYVAGADFYVGDTIATLFNAENRVHTTQGEKQIQNEFGDMVLDPAYDYTERMISCDLYGQGGKQGRYVAFVITRAHPVNTRGYSLARIGELEVDGIMLQPEEPFDSARQTLTDAATGISATISRLNLDDIEFFNGLQMTVTRTALPAGVETDIEQHWLRVDSDVYTLTLKNAAGHVYTADEVGERYWTIRIPKTGSYFQMAGQLKNGVVERVRNSRTDAAEEYVLLGNSSGNAATLHGNGLQLVLLRYHDAATINTLNGVLYADDIQVYNTKGAESVHREGSPAATSVWLIPAALLLAAGGAAGTFVTRKRRKRTGKGAV